MGDMEAIVSWLLKEKWHNKRMRHTHAHTSETSNNNSNIQHSRHSLEHKGKRIILDTRGK